MALASFSTTEVSTEGDCRSMGLRVVARSSQAAFDQHQRYADASSAFRRHVPAAVNQLQACELGGSVDLPFFSRITHRLSCPSRDSRLVAECAFAGAPVITNFRSRPGSRPSSFNALAHEQVFQCLAHAPHSQAVLSSSLASRWIDPNEKELTHAYKPLPSRGKDHV